VGESSETTSEATPAPEVADAQSAAPALDEAVPVAVPGGPASAPQAARMLVGGGRGGVMPPKSRQRLTPGAALALQRSVGNRALSQRILMRDGPKEKTPLMPPVGTAQEIADWAAQEVKAKHRDKLLVLDLERKEIWVFEDAAAPHAVKRLNLKVYKNETVLLPLGVWMWHKDPGYGFPRHLYDTGWFIWELSNKPDDLTLNADDANQVAPEEGQQLFVIFPPKGAVLDPDNNPYEIVVRGQKPKGREKDWAVHDVVNARARIDGTKSKPSKATAKRPAPTQLVPWTKDGKWYLNVWLGGDHRTVELDPNQATDDLVERILKKTEELKAEDDPARSTRVQGTRPGPPEFTGPRQPYESTRPLPGHPPPGEYVAGKSPFNQPAFPAKIVSHGAEGSAGHEGAEITVNGATVPFTMSLDFQAVTSGLTAAALGAGFGGINYEWEIFDISKVTLGQLKGALGKPSPELQSEIDALKQEVADEPDAAKRKDAEAQIEALQQELDKRGKDPDSGRLGDIARDWANTWEDTKEDLTSVPMFIPGVNIAWVGLIAVSDIVQLVGAPIRTLFAWLSAPRHDKSIEFPNAGTFLIRCTAWQEITESDAARMRQHGLEPAYRPPSIAYITVRVTPINKRATEVNDAELTGIESLKKVIELTPDDDERADYQQQLKDAQNALADNNLEAIERARRATKQEIESAKQWRKLQLDDVPLDKIDTKLLKWKARLDLRGLSVDEWQKAQEEADKQLDETYQRVSTYGLAGCDTTAIYRPRVTLVSEVDGQAYPIVANLVQENDSTAGARRWRLIDATSKDTKRVYKGSGATHNEAINDAFKEFKWRAAYGRGTIAIRLPDELKQIDGEQISVPAQMRAQPGFGERFEQRLSDLATAAEVASLFVTGPIGAAIGIGAGLIGAGLAIKNFITRIEAGKPVLSWETAMDAFAVVTAFTFAGQAARKSARFAALADRAKWVGKTVHVLSTAGQVIIIPAQTYLELQQITDEEAAALTAAGGDPAKVDHGRYNARRMMAWARGIKSGAVMVRMTQMGSDPELGWDPLKKKGAPGGKPIGRPGEQPPGEIKPPTAGKPAAGEPHPATTSGDPLPGAGGKPLPPSVHEPAAPHDPFHAAQQNGAVPSGSGEAVIKAAGDWKLRLRQTVDQFEPAKRTEAAQELNETRRNALDAEYSKADAAHGCVPFDVGTVAFDSDIDATMIPKEALADHTGPRRPINEQITAAAEAAQQVVDGLRRRFGGDPDAVLDVAIHAYVGEDVKPQYKSAAEEAAARAHDTAVSWAEMRRGMTREEWLQLEADYTARLDRPDSHPAERQMLEQIRQQMVEGFRFKQRMDDLLLDTVENVVVESKGKLTSEQAESLARDRILLDKRRQLAEAFKGYPDVDWVAIKKLQAEIRWAAPGAYASESAFAYAVKYGQVRKQAGKGAAKASGGGQPTTSQVLSDLNPNLDEERWVSPADRSSRLANVANANIGELGRHPHGAEPKSQAKDAAKYAGRVLEAAETMGGPVKHGPIEDALRLFKQSKWPDGTPELRDRAVARWADQAIDGKGVTHNADGSVTITNETYSAFSEAAKAWMRKTAIEARITERAMSDRTDVPERPTPKPKPEPPAPAPATPILDAAGLSAEARTRVLAAMPPETANAVAGWMGKERLESISNSPVRLKELVEAHQRVLAALTDPLAVAGLRRLTEKNPKLPGSQNALSDASMLDAIMRANPDNLALALRVLGRPDMQTPGLHPQRSKNVLADLSHDITRLTAIDKFGPDAYEEIGRNRAVRMALEEKVEGLEDPAARASAIEQILNAETTAQRRGLLGLPGPKRRSRSLEVKPDKSDPQAWKEYEDDARAFVKDPERAKSINPRTGEPYSAMTEQQLADFIEARATLLQIRDRFADPAGYKQFQKLSQEQKLRILDQMDALAETRGVLSQWNPRARVAEALFVPGGGFGQKTFPNPVFPSPSGGTGGSRLDGVFKPGERTNGPTGAARGTPLNSDRTEWIEFKSNKTLSEGLAEQHAKEGFEDWHALLWDKTRKDDGLVMWYAREPPAPVKAKMLAKLLGADSPFSAVRFGDGDWIPRAADTPMPTPKKLPPWWQAP
jgi:hypothetical protein